MIHYHGGPLNTEASAIRLWQSRHAFVSFARKEQTDVAGEVSHSFALDNGAYIFWKGGKTVDWNKYYQWVDTWRGNPRFDFAVIPDVINGTEEENDALLDDWPFSRYESCAVWHVNESVGRLVRLAKRFPRIALGSCNEYDVTYPEELLKRMYDVLPKIVDTRGHPIVKLHGLRMLNPKIFRRLPLKSADSTTIARGCFRDVRWKGSYQPKSVNGRIDVMVDNIERHVSCSKAELGLAVPDDGQFTLF